jgi:hypothetical protein
MSGPIIRPLLRRGRDSNLELILEAEYNRILIALLQRDDQRLPGGRVHDAGDWKRLRLLKSLHGGFRLRAVLALNIAVCAGLVVCDGKGLEHFRRVPMR